MSQNVILKAQGLHTNNNIFSAAPSGSMSEAVNVVIDRSEIVEPRRGWYQYGTIQDLAKQLLSYKKRIIAHVNSGLVYDMDGFGTMYPISGDIVEQVDSIHKIRSIESNGNLYFTTLNGIKKIVARTADDLFSTSTIEAAGMVKATNLYAKLNYQNSLGFLEPNSKVAYRMVLGRKDLNENLVLGSPSPSVMVYNISTGSCNVDLTFDIPPGVKVGDIFQIYRTGLSTEIFPTEPGAPGDEMNLVLEDIFTVNTGSITVTDITLDSFRKSGALLYTNPVSGEGINQANEPPPFAKDICTYKGFTFLANTKTVQRLFVDVVAVDDIASVGLPTQTSGSLVIGNTYTIMTYNIGDDFTNVGGTNVSGNTFIATGTTPTTWTNSSILQRQPTTLSVSDGATVETYTFQGTFETETINYNAVAAASDFYNAAPGPAKYFTLASSNDERLYYVWFSFNTTNDLDPKDTILALNGYIGIKVDISAAVATQDSYMTEAKNAIDAITSDFNLTLDDTDPTNTLYAECSNNGPVATILTTNIAGLVTSKNGLGTGEDAANNKIFLPKVPTGGINGPQLEQQLEECAKSIAKVLTKQSSIVNVYYSSASDDIPGKLIFEQKNIIGAQFWLNSNAPTDSFNPSIYPIGHAKQYNVISTNDVRPNRIYYSKKQIPDAFPVLNYIDIGAKDREIIRIIPLRDSLFILKEDGIYKLTGDSAFAGNNNFNIIEFDFSVQILAPNSVSVLNNQIYALSSQGVCTISDTVVSIISRPIENQINKILKAGNNYKSYSFGIPYESDRSYLLFTIDDTIPDSTVKQAFRYNTFTNTWSKFLKEATCGIINFADDKMYLGASDDNLIEVERKNLNRTDFCDRQYTVNIGSYAFDLVNKTIKLNDVTKAHKGDILLQRQYLTLDDYNSLLKKLDNDYLINNPIYFNTLEASTGDNLRDKLEALATTLDSNGGNVDTNYLASISNITPLTITNITKADQAVITIGAHTIPVGRYVAISGTNCLPSLDGVHEVIAAGPTTITVDVKTLQTGNAGSLDLAITDFRDIQKCFNIISAKLNADDGVYYTNYNPSEDYVDYECIIDSKNTQLQTITVDRNLNLIQGDAFILDAIESYIVYNPQFFGDPSVEKQVSEGTFTFENSNFSKATVAFSSDKHPEFIEIDFTRPGNGDFGQFNFGGGAGVNFGGVAAPIPLRTYLPLDKQRCRFINIKFYHKVALEKYSLFATSLKFRPYNTRSYR